MITMVGRRNEEAEIREWLDSLDLPNTIVEYRLILDVDWEGDPKVNIDFILTDDLNDVSFREEAERIRRKVMEAFHQSNLARWPFPYFSQKSEQDELDAEERRERRGLGRRRTL